MNSADLATVVIVCPHCATRYQVPFATLGAAGRDVQCAHCGQSWHALADQPPPPPIDPDALFDPGEEKALDIAFEQEASAMAPMAAALPVDPDHARTLAEIRAAIAPKPRRQNVNAIDQASLNKFKKSFDLRQRKVSGRLPMARVRRTARLAALTVLLSMLVLGYALRTDIVRWFPSLAGLYATIGLPVNIVGLEFENSKTVSSLRDGKTMMQISARIRSVAGRVVTVPPVLVSLFNDKGIAVYEWTVTSPAAEMSPGEILDFSTEVNSPPPGAVKVRLSFTAKVS